MAVGLLFPIVAGGGVALADFRAQQSDGDEGEQAPLDSSGPSGGDGMTQGAFSTFPLVTWRGYRPTRSQEYRASNHHGVDLMFERRIRGGGGEPGDMYPAGSQNGTAAFFMPEQIYVIAVADATIWQSGQSPRGWFVVLDHGPPYATFYQHMSSLLVPSGISRGAANDDSPGAPYRVRAGEVLGIVGGDPLDVPQKLKHLHFEIWKGGGAESHVDPWPLIQSLAVLDMPVHVQGDDS